ncbi:hypothetical protein ACE38V_10435 [Cytobacillus sp. Hz8]|uniref:hypothetical protein n=1 Tax=Cytobacillus sp. Hz8 TaxID=3347168 RepID=UPI0035E2247C
MVKVDSNKARILFGNIKSDLFKILEIKEEKEDIWDNNEFLVEKIKLEEKLKV